MSRSKEADSRVVDQNLNRTQGGLGFVDELGHLHRTGHVSNLAEHVLGQLLQGFRAILQCRSVSSANRHGCAEFRQAMRDGTPDAPAAAGDESYIAVK